MNGMICDEQPRAKRTSLDFLRQKLVFTTAQRSGVGLPIIFEEWVAFIELAVGLLCWGCQALAKKLLGTPASSASSERVFSSSNLFFDKLRSCVDDTTPVV